MHFLDAWAALPSLELLRLVVPAGLMLVAVLAPGRLFARLTALGLAVSSPFLCAGVPAWVAAGWAALWLVIARQAGRRSGRTTRSGARLGGLESGTVGLLLAAALLALLVAGVARLDLDAARTRQAALGVVLVGLGFLHLMLRRHAVRAGVAFAAMGLGLQVLQAAARAGATPGAVLPEGLPLGGAVLGAALAAGVGRARLATTGSAWVSDAHDLHD